MSRLANVFVLALSLVACGGGVNVAPSVTDARKPPKAASESPRPLIEQGVQYDLLARRQAVASTKGRVEVVEFFWYGCPHCYTLEAHLVIWNRLKKPGYVDFVRVPATWGDRQKAHARLYYVLRELGREDLHNEVFDTIHRLGNPLYEKGDEMRTFQEQLQFARAHGIATEEFAKVYRSAAVDVDLQRATDLALQYKTAGVPTLIVHGKYTTDPGRTKSNEAELIETVNALIAKEASAAEGSAAEGRVTSAGNTDNTAAVAIAAE